MRTTATGKLRVLAGDDARDGRDWLWYAFVALFVIALAAGLVGDLWGGRTIRALPGEQRLAVYSRSMEELRSTCAPGFPEALGDHCRELASFLAGFPECRGDCESRARELLAPRPTR